MWSGKFNGIFMKEKTNSNQIVREKKNVQNKWMKKKKKQHLRKSNEFYYYLWCFDCEIFWARSIRHPLNVLLRSTVVYSTCQSNQHKNSSSLVVFVYWIFFLILLGIRLVDFTVSQKRYSFQWNPPRHNVWHYKITSSMCKIHLVTPVADCCCFQPNRFLQIGFKASRACLRQIHIHMMSMMNYIEFVNFCTRSSINQINAWIFPGASISVFSD